MCPTTGSSTATTRTAPGNERRLLEVAEQARALMDQHGLEEWTFRFSAAQRKLGECREREKVILLSRRHAVSGTPGEVRDTILHEIAHAIAGAKARHGPAWKLVAKRIGATPRARAEESEEIRQEHAGSEGKVSRRHGGELPEPGRAPPDGRHRQDEPQAGASELQRHRVPCPLRRARARREPGRGRGLAGLSSARAGRRACHAALPVLDMHVFITDRAGKLPHRGARRTMLPWRRRSVFRYPTRGATVPRRSWRAGGMPMIAVILAAGGDTVAHREAQAKGPASVCLDLSPARDTR